MSLATNTSSLDEWENASDKREASFAQRRWTQGAVVLAVAGLCFLQGYRVADGGASPVVYEAGVLVAAGELESVLYEPSLGAREEGPKVSDAFINSAAQTCRRFLDGSVTGVACRANGDWRVIEIQQKPTTPSP
jgi:hypothetical protein